MEIFVVHDTKADMYLSPNAQQSVADARRSWSTVANEGDSPIRKFPHDFRLLHIASFDNTSGKLTAFDVPVDLGFAHTYLKNDAAVPLPFPKSV